MKTRNLGLSLLIIFLVLGLLLAFSAVRTPANATWFSVKISTQESSFKVGDDVTLYVMVTNTSRKTLFVDIPFGEDLLDEVSVTAPSGAPAAKTDFARTLNSLGRPTGKMLAPGEVEEEEITVNQLYDMTSPGT